MERSEGEDGDGGSEEESAKLKGERRDRSRGPRFLFPEMGKQGRGMESQGFPPRLGEFAMLGTPKWGWKDV